MDRKNATIWRDGLTMTEKKAFWQALAVVGIPNLVIWGALLYFLRAVLPLNGWPLYLIFIALPFPLVFLLYKRYRREVPDGSNINPRLRLTLAILLMALGATKIAGDVLEHRGWSLALRLTPAIGWLAIGGANIRNWRKAKASLPKENLEA
ncbi:MAG TPA: hypothetical protein VKZ53_25965 [Candidatus Angelobacter sp.]|nr:hypothetical protein [Candidatus Angelobacter sp.]